MNSAFFLKAFTFLVKDVLGKSQKLSLILFSLPVLQSFKQYNSLFNFSKKKSSDLFTANLNKYSRISVQAPKQRQPESNEKYR